MTPEAKAQERFEIPLEFLREYPSSQYSGACACCGEAINVGDRVWILRDMGKRPVNPETGKRVSPTWHYAHIQEKAGQTAAAGDMANVRKSLQIRAKAEEARYAPGAGAKGDSAAAGEGHAATRAAEALREELARLQERYSALEETYKSGAGAAAKAKPDPVYTEEQDVRRVPAPMPGFIDPPELAMIQACIRLGAPVALVGEPGAGKTEAAVQACANLGRPLAFYSCSQGASYSNLIARRDALEGKTVVTRMLVSMAVERGHALVLDELGAAAPSVLAALHSLLAGQGLPIAEEQSLLKPASGFAFVATSNYLASERGDAVHETAISGALADRMAVLSMRPYGPGIETAIALRKLGIAAKMPKVPGTTWDKLEGKDEERAESISNWASHLGKALVQLRKAARDGDIGFAPSRRMLQLAIALFADGGEHASGQALILRGCFIDRYPESQRANVTEILQRATGVAVPDLGQHIGE